jgi:hypothetical protein
MKTVVEEKYIPILKGFHVPTEGMGRGSFDNSCRTEIGQGKSMVRLVESLKIFGVTRNRGWEKNHNHP